MNRNLSVSRAARLAGVSRGEIQKRIRAGEIQTFEGAVSATELRRAYPGIDAERDAALERAARLQEQAAAKLPLNEVSSETQLLEQVQRLQAQLADEQARSRYYRGLVVDLKDRLVEMQGDCDRRQRAMLQALVSWMLRKLDRAA